MRRRTIPSDRYTIVSNASLRDCSLSWAARGLLAWLLSHAVGYEITEAMIIGAGPLGRDGVRAMVRELETAGYLCRERVLLPGGGSTVDYVLIDPDDGKAAARDDGNPVVQADQAKQNVSAAQPDDGISPPPSLLEDQEKTNTKTSSSLRAARSTMTATRLPDGFMPDEKMRAWFADEKLAAVIDGRIEHEKFVDYFAGAPGVKGRKVDWPATWRNWMRTAAERAPRRPGNALAPISGAPYKPSTTDARISQGMALAAKYEEQGL